jgi:hypothetical protein
MYCRKIKDKEQKLINLKKLIEEDENDDKEEEETGNET